MGQCVGECRPSPGLCFRSILSGRRFQRLSPKLIAAPVRGTQLRHKLMRACLQETALSCMTYDTWYGTHEVVAPFVLENLGCSGDEARLLDCPVFDSDTVTPAYDSSGFDYFEDYINPETCDPIAGGGGTFARVACGTSSSAGLRLLSVLCVYNAASHLRDKSVNGFGMLIVPGTVI